MMKIKVGIVEDHQLFLKSLSLLLETLTPFVVVIEAANGKELIEKLSISTRVPDILLVDVNMPVMDGVETCQWMLDHFPAVKTVALTMNDDEHTIIRMFKAGCSAYLLKDMHPVELESALLEVQKSGFYVHQSISLDRNKLFRNNHFSIQVQITPKELQFLQYACSDRTYKQIASEMKVSERTVDGYRESLFGKLQVQSRVGLCLVAIKMQLVKNW
jgi:DNA-binding NarL/FixJ family response regulator